MRWHLHWRSGIVRQLSADARTLAESEVVGGRGNEWYALRRGPKKLRTLINLLFLPYTLMNISFVVIGSMLPSTIHWDRAEALVVVYVVAVGFSAHALDAMGPNRPWGDLLSRRELGGLALASLVPALALGGYYAIAYSPWLLLVGAVELFFLFAYNLNMFGSRFHSEHWFAFSWGFLPVLAGYVLQTNGISLSALFAGLFALAVSYVQANASRPYKELKSKGIQRDLADRFERILQGVVGGSALLALAMVLLRLLG